MIGQRMIPWTQMVCTHRVFYWACSSADCDLLITKIDKQMSSLLPSHSCFCSSCRNQSTSPYLSKSTFAYHTEIYLNSTLHNLHILSQLASQLYPIHILDLSFGQTEGNFIVCDLLHNSLLFNIIAFWAGEGVTNVSILKEGNGP